MLSIIVYWGYGDLCSYATLLTEPVSPIKTHVLTISIQISPSSCDLSTSFPLLRSVVWPTVTGLPYPALSWQFCLTGFLAYDLEWSFWNITFLFNVYLFFLRASERASVCVWVGEGPRGRKRILSRREIMTWAKIKSQTLNQLSYPGTKGIFLFISQARDTALLHPLWPQLVRSGDGGPLSSAYKWAFINS